MGQLRSFVCTVFLLGACGGNSNARHLAKAGNYAEAEAAADKNLKSTPDDTEAWRTKIKSIMHQADYDRAAKLYEDYVASRGKHDESLAEDMALISIWQAFEMPSPPIRRRAIEIVESQDVDMFLEYVGKSLSDEDPKVVATAAVAILNSPGVPKILSRLLNHKNADVRLIITRGIARKGKDPMRRALAKRLKDPNASVRAAAVSGLLDDDVELALPLMRDQNGSVRAAALRRIIASDHPKAPATAKAALADKYPGVVLAAISGLNPQRERQTLESLTSKGSPLIRLTAASKLGAQGTSVTEQYLNHDKVSIALAAARNIPGQYPKAQALKKLGGLLAHRHNNVKIAGARMLIDMGQDKRAQAVLEEMLPLASGETEVEIARQLARSGHAKGIKRLSDLVWGYSKAGTSDKKLLLRQAIGAHGSGNHLTTGLVAGLSADDPLLRLDAALQLLRST